MARKRSMDVFEVKMYAAFGGLRMPVAQVEEAVKGGAKLEMEESGFSDGADYTRVLLDGKVIGYMGGY